MCGIICILGDSSKISSSSLYHRGPDDMRVSTLGDCCMAFFRLAINDKSDLGMQPFSSSDGKTMIACNGEIYNHEIFGGLRNSFSDCECILPLVNKIGIFQASKRLLGEFAFCWTDGTKIQASRDPVGVRPLFYTKLTGGGIAFASEVKALIPFGTRVDIFPPGHT